MDELVRVRLDVQYDGTKYNGWARQRGFPSVQQELEEKLAKICSLDEPPRTVCAGRTDAGVHARGQVVHVDLPRNSSGMVSAPRGLPLEPDARETHQELKLAYQLRSVLPEDITVPRATLAPDGFDARFSALSRRYSYTISDGHRSLDPLRRHDIYAHRPRLDVELMNGAAQVLMGEHDFAAFCRWKPNATTIRTLLELHWYREDSLAKLHIKADAFCHSMVRSLVGVLLPVGEGREPASFVAEQLMRTSGRGDGFAVAPAHGLVLEEVEYPPDAAMAARAAITRARRQLL